MQAMVFHEAKTPLRLETIDLPDPQGPKITIRIEACGVCRTDLHVVDGDLASPKLPLVPGHEIVGRVAAMGPGVSHLQIGQRVGVPWLGRTCSQCAYCRTGRENLCDTPEFTGYTVNGGFAEGCIADARYVFPLSDISDPVALAPLLCAGLIGYRSLKLAGEARGAGPLRLWRRSAYPDADCNLAGARRSCTDPARRYRGSEIRQKPRRGLGRRIR